MIQSSTFNGATREFVLKTLTYRNGIFAACAATVTPCSNRTLILSEEQADASLGHLERLPTELLQLVIGVATLQSTLALRMVNKRARIFVNSSIPFKYVRLHAMPAVGVLVLTGMASHFTVQELFEALCSPACSACGQLGEFLWMLECKRCCYNCLRTLREFMPVHVNKITRAYYGVPQEFFDSLPVLATLRGTYGRNLTRMKPKSRFLSPSVIRKAAVQVHGGADALETHIQTRVSSKVRAVLECELSEAARFMASVRLPVYDPVAQVRYYGLSCKGCQHAARGAENALAQQQALTPEQELHLLERDRTYTEEGYLEHYERCFASQTLWRESCSNNLRNG
ncbi:hypothetical protein NEOLEDRAFT_131391 [Neolentinus lepideus HHB14362 ss-1]|uniref:F-box domain-containing protein n=1 Tax=Neolentinus lepideus HHB14362 ss-1 TaxID=1314782 RepID=A0A165TWV4_9AGAM|nr:hypothetical protein NEOLEDRAFT_131391 [Neolentinus lepideus HHB14362 ss-1]